MYICLHHSLRVLIGNICYKLTGSYIRHKLTQALHSRVPFLLGSKEHFDISTKAPAHDQQQERLITVRTVVKEQTQVAAQCHLLTRE